MIYNRPEEAPQSALRDAMQAAQSGANLARGGQVGSGAGNNGGEQSFVAAYSGAKTAPQQAAMAVGPQAQTPINMEAINNLIKAQLQPAQYSGLGGFDVDNLNKNFQQALGQLQQHFLGLIR